MRPFDLAAVCCLVVCGPWSVVFLVFTVCGVWLGTKMIRSGGYGGTYECEVKKRPLQPPPLLLLVIPQLNIPPRGAVLAHPLAVALCTRSRMSRRHCMNARERAHTHRWLLSVQLVLNCNWESEMEEGGQSEVGAGEHD